MTSTTTMATAPVYTKYINTNENFVVESGDMGSAATFARNSCDPNCQLKNIYLPNGKCIPVLVATRDIRCNEEITRDYSFHLYVTWYKACSVDSRVFTECECGSKNCRRFMDTERTYDLKSSLGQFLMVSNPVEPVRKSFEIYILAGLILNFILPSSLLVIHAKVANT